MAVATANEGLVLDDLALNDENPWRILDGTFQFTPAKKKLNWAGSPMADGAAPIGDEDHYENSEMVFRLRLENQNSEDEALSLLSELTSKLQSARSIRGGLPLTWTPSGSGNSLTLYVLEAEYDEMPMSYEEGWTTAAPQVVVHLYLRPFLYGFEQRLMVGLSDPFAFDSLTNGTWRFETPIPPADDTMTITGGLLTVTSTAAKRLYRSQTTITDASVTMRFRTGTTTTGSAGIILKHLTSGSANNLDRLFLNFVGSSQFVSIQKVVNGAGFTLASSTTFTPATNTWYWLQAGIVGNDVSAAIYADAQDPLNNPFPTPLAITSYTLTGTSPTSDAVMFGSQAYGNPGINTTPSDLSWQFDQWTLRESPNFITAEPIFGFEIPEVEGHVPAEGRLVITEATAQNRSHFEWGLESRNYDPTLTWPFLVDSSTFLTGSFAGNPANVSGAYNPTGVTNNAVTATNISETVALAVCSTGSQSHVGDFKVKIRAQGTAGVKCRLNWRIGDGPGTRNDYAPELSGVDWQELDLGTIIIPEAGIGTQSWTGRIEAVGVSGGSVSIDYVELIPLERFGVARAPLRPIVPSSYSAFDNFIQTPQAVLNAKTLGSGQTWATSGATTDYNVTGSPEFQVRRSAISDTDTLTGRYALAGSTNYAGIQVQADVGCTTAPDRDTDITGLLRMGIVLRYNDANNWLMCVRTVVSVDPGGQPGDLNHSTRLRLYKRVGGGSAIQLGSFNEATTPETHRTIICQVDAAGVYQVYSFWPGATQPAQPQIVGQDSVLATGGGLQDGKIGLYDAYASDADLTRDYDNFVAFDSQTPVVMYSGRHLEVRADRTERESPGGGSYGRVPTYRGARFLVPPTTGGQTARVAIKARRNDVDGGLPDNQISDTIAVVAYATPRYLVPS